MDEEALNESIALTIRPGRRGDARSVVALWRALDDVLPSATDDEEAVRLLVDRDADSLLVAEAGGRMVGILIVGWDGWRGNLYRLAVDPACRRRGIAMALVTRAEQRLHARGCRRIAAAVETSAQQAVRFWTAAGYAVSPSVGRFVKNLGAAAKPGCC